MTSNSDENSLRTSVKEIIIHPDWNIYTSSYDADVAIVKLKNSVNFNNFNNFIQSIKIQSDVTEFKAIGYVVSGTL